MDKPVKEKKKYAGPLIKWGEPDERGIDRWQRQWNELGDENIIGFIRRGVEVGAVPSIKRARSGGSLCLSVFWNGRSYDKWFQSAEDAIPVMAAFDDLFSQIASHSDADDSAFSKKANRLYEGS